MRNNRQIRKQLGLSQEGLATLLGTNRFTILRMEKGKAALDTSSLRNLADLQKFLEEDELKPAKVTIDITSYCRKLEEDDLFRLAILKRKLVSMRKRFEKSCRLRSLLEQQNASTDKRTRAWLATQTIKMEKTANGCSETKQAALQVLIMTCEAQLAAIRKYMRQNKIRPAKTNLS